MAYCSLMIQSLHYALWAGRKFFSHKIYLLFPQSDLDRDQLFCYTLTLTLTLTLYPNPIPSCKLNPIPSPIPNPINI